MIFGWLGDRLGRVRAMTLSVLTYAIFSGLCGFSQAPWHLFFFRFLASMGMGGEWSLGCRWSWNCGPVPPGPGSPA